MTKELIMLTSAQNPRVIALNKRTGAASQFARLSTSKLDPDLKVLAFSVLGLLIAGVLTWLSGTHLDAGASLLNSLS
jgi:hypothetical protein